MNQRLNLKISTEKLQSFFVLVWDFFVVFFLFLQAYFSVIVNFSKAETLIKKSFLGGQVVVILYVGEWLKYLYHK